MGVLWTAAKYIYILVLPHLELRAVYGPFEVSVGLITWAFISGPAAARRSLRLGHAPGPARDARRPNLQRSMTKRQPSYWNDFTTMSFG